MELSGNVRKTLLTGLRLSSIRESDYVEQGIRKAVVEKRRGRPRRWRDSSNDTNL